MFRVSLSAIATINLTLLRCHRLRYHCKCGGTGFALHRVTENLEFSIDGSIVGNGNFSRLTHISELSGVEADEKSGRVCGLLKSANNGLGMHSTRIYADSI